MVQIYSKGHEILTTMKVKITSVWVMTPCILLGRNHSLGVSRCFHPVGTCLLTHSLFARTTLHPAHMQCPAIRNSPPHTSFNKRSIMMSRKL